VYAHECSTVSVDANVRENFDGPFMQVDFSNGDDVYLSTV